MFVRQQARPSVKIQNRDDLVALKELVEAGKVTPVIDGTYPLSETPAGDRPRRRGPRPRNGRHHDGRTPARWHDVSLTSPTPLTELTTIS